MDKIIRKKIPTENLIKVAEFVLKNNYFEFDTNVYQHISRTAIGTKFAPPYTCIFMDQLETKFLESQNLKPLVCFRYIDDMFLYGPTVKKIFKTLWPNLTYFVMT